MCVKFISLENLVFEKQSLAHRLNIAESNDGGK